MIGVFNINKPSGVTSSNVVVKIKKFLNQKKVGHMGTLDPLASGVLPICVGKATRLFDYFLKKQKTYIAHFKFGEETDTLDLEGKVIKTCNIIPNKKEIEFATKSFLGDTSQVPPAYSSKKIDGKKAYDLAREGKEVQLKPCNITIFNFEVIKQIDEQTFEFKIVCSAGTYIRAIGRDLGYKLNTCATMTRLIRTKSGPFNIENALDYNLLTREGLENNIIPLNVVLKDFEKLVINEEIFQNLLNGKFVSIKQPANTYALFLNNKVVGIAEINKEGILKVKTYLFE